MIQYSIAPNGDGFIDAVNQIIERSLYSVWLDTDNSMLIVKDTNQCDVLAMSCNATLTDIKAIYMDWVATSNFFNFSI